jgi:PAS domain S-box-containing protein
MMFSHLNILVLFTAIWLLSAAILGAHRSSLRFGLAPPLFLLGGITAILQFRFLGIFNIQVWDQIQQLSYTSLILLPPLLLGILFIYIANDSTQARNILAGIGALSLLIAIVQTLLTFFPTPPALWPFDAGPGGPALRLSMISAFTLMIDLIALILTYQTISNTLNRHPSQIALTVAIFISLWCDSLLFSFLGNQGSDNWLYSLAGSLSAKTIVALAVLPLAWTYLHKSKSIFPTATTSSRPALDLFSSQLQLEAEARYQQSLLRTLSQINQLVVRATDPQTLLEQACQLLAAGRSYPLVWIGTLDRESLVVQLAAVAGERTDQLTLIEFGSQPDSIESNPATPAYAVARTGKPVLLADIHLQNAYSTWQEAALRAGFRSSAAYPMRHSGHVLGILSVYSPQIKAFGKDEIALLQELADDLAYALVSLEARRQQLILQTAVETMHDGLLISDTRGRIVYANPTITNMVGHQPAELVGKNVLSFLPPNQAAIFLSEESRRELSTRQITAEFDQPGRNGSTITISLQAALASDPLTQASFIVSSIRDVTKRYEYERQLLTLSQLTTEMVQIHEPQSLLPAILAASQQLLKADASGIYLVDDLTSNLTEVITRNLSENHRRLFLELFSSSSAKGQILEPICIEDFDHSEHPHLECLRQDNIHALMLLPIRYQSRPMGLLGFYYVQPREIKTEILQLGQTVTHTLAISLQNARLYQAERNQHQVAEALTQATAALNSSLDLDEVLDEILVQTSLVLPCRSENLMLVENECARVARIIDRRESPRPKRIDSGTHLSLATYSLNKMYTSGLPLLIPDTRAETHWVTLEKSSWILSYAGAPLVAQGQIIGFLNLNSDQPNYFDHESIRHLQAFAATAATAIQNARLFQDLQKHTLELEDRVRERTAELKAAKERIERILVSVPDAVFVLDEADRLVQANPAGETLLLQAEQTGIDLFDGEFLAHVKSGDGPAENAVLEVAEHAYQALASRHANLEQWPGLVIGFRDVTRFRELDQMKSKFVSDVSHELRTPLTNLTIYLDLLANMNDPSKGQHYLDTLQRETERLTHLIEDLLTISRLEGGRLPISLLPIDVQQLTYDLTKDRQSIAAMKELCLTCNVEQDLPRVQADPRLLSQVLSNLLTNAFNYTPAAGDIQVTTGLCGENGAKWVTISVQDTGVGILPGEIDEIFERFYRGSASYQTGAPGTGLGLAISREIIQRMGGKITVESTPGLGSNFTVWLKPVL